MAIRITPHVLSRIDWNNPLDDPIRKQFIPLASCIIPDHEHLKLDSLEEEKDSRMFTNNFITAGSNLLQLFRAWSVVTLEGLCF
jgi:hypothetical protein